jgi:tape measure domain-containing protein
MATSEELTLIIKAAADQAINDINKLNTALGQTPKKGDEVGKTFSNINTAIKTFIGYEVTKAVVGLGVSCVDGAAKMEQYATTFEVLLGSAEAAKKMLEDIKTFSKATPFEIPGITETATRLLAFNIPANEIITTMSMLGDVAMGDAEKFGRVADAYGKINVKGKATMEEMNRLLEAGVPILDALASKYNTSTAAIVDMAEKGKIKFSDVKTALTNLTTGSGQFAGMMDKQSQTFIGVMSNVKDSIGQTAAEIGAEMLPGLKDLGNAFLSLSGTNFAEGILNDLKTVGRAISDVATGLGLVLQGMAALGTDKSLEVQTDQINQQRDAIKTLTAEKNNLINTYKLEGETYQQTWNRISQGMNDEATLLRQKINLQNVIANNVSTNAATQLSVADQIFKSNDKLWNSWNKTATDSISADRKIIQSKGQLGGATQAQVNEAITKQAELYTMVGLYAEATILKEQNKYNQLKALVKAYHIDIALLDAGASLNKDLAYQTELGKFQEFLDEKQNKDLNDELIRYQQLQLDNESHFQLTGQYYANIEALTAAHEKNKDAIKEKYYQTDKQRIVQSATSYLSVASSLMSQLQTVYSLYYSNKTAELTNQENKELAILKDQYGKGLISEDQYNKQKAAIESKYDKESKKIAHDQAVGQKNLNIAAALINGAQAILQCYSQLGPIGGTIAAAIMAGLVGYQINLIKNTPIPAAYEGALIKGSSSGTLLRAGERGQSEAIIPLGAGLEQAGLGLGNNNYITLNIENLFGTEDMPHQVAEKIDIALYKLQQGNNSRFGASIGR